MLQLNVRLTPSSGRKASILVAAALLFGAAAGAHAQITKAGAMAKACAEFTKGSTGDSTQQMACAGMFSGFIAGWNAGITRGTTSAFVLDEQNLATTKGAADLAARMNAIRPQTQCIAASGVSFPQMLERYVAYVVARPDRWNDDFDVLAVEMIENTICGHKIR